MKSDLFKNQLLFGLSPLSMAPLWLKQPSVPLLRYEYALVDFYYLNDPILLQKTFLLRQYFHSTDDD